MSTPSLRPTPIRAVLFTLIGLLCPFVLWAQTPVLEATNSSDVVVFQSNDDGALFAPGTVGTGTLPATGAGTRLLWHPAKAALRAGRAGSDEWDNGNVGAYSVATGFGSRASGQYSVALGGFTQATAEGAVALGAGEATQNYASALGSGNATGEYATAFGFRPTASGNYAVAGGEGSAATARAATAFGLDSDAQGYASVALGDNATASDSRSYAIGTGVVATNSGAVAIGNDAKANGQNSVAIGSGVRTSSANGAALGTKARAGGQGAFVFGDRSTISTTTADTVVAGQNEFVARASGGVEFYTSSDLSSGAELPAGSGSWSTLSDSTMKENMSAVDPADILAGVTRLPVHQWNYKTQSDHVRHMGPTAQTFHSTFGLGANNTTISTVDIDGVNMAAIQALAARTEALQSENEALEARVARLEQLVETRSSLPAGLGGPLGMSLLLLVVIGGGAIVWRVRAAQA